VHTVPGILFNCASPESITLALKEVRADAGLIRRLRDSGVRLGAYANRLTPIAPDWSLGESDGPQEMRGDLSPQAYWAFVRGWINDYGVGMVGGCCGITPEHIAYLNSKLDVQTEQNANND